MAAPLLGILSGLGSLAVLGAVLFGSAGRWDVPWFWAYLGVWAAWIVVAPLLVDPGLVRERLRPGPGGQDYSTAAVFLVLGLAQHVAAGLDVGRLHWSDGVPPVLRAVGLLAMAAALAVIVWAMAVNRFFSSVIRIQADRGHHLVTSGPYGFVRHPAYAAAPLLVVAVGLVLGSWLAALLGLVPIGPILRRTAREDRVLRARLAGYDAYAGKVRYRLLPGVW